MLNVLCGVNDELIIDGDIKVTVLEIRDDHVRLSISDPRNDPPYWEQTVYCSEHEHSELLPR